MSIATTLEEKFPGVITPDFLSRRLRDLMLRNRGSKRHEQTELVNEALNFAAEAEQTITAQSARISELESLAVTDELTGLHNRRGLKQALIAALDLAIRHRESGVLAFLDLDDFKSINDFHGHEAGDSMLRHTASLLTAQLRASDIVARVGGDEFAILLTRADPIIGINRAADLQIELNRSTVYFDNMELPLSVSMGTQTFGAGDTVNSILRKADLAMYRDKRLRQCKKSPAH